MKIVLDTCVLSEIRNPMGSEVVKETVSRIPDEDLFLSVLSTGEIMKGIELLEASKKKNSLTTWLDGLQSQFSDRILPIDNQTALIWGSITARLSKMGISLPSIDGLLAATVLRHHMHLMTRNTRHFEATGAIIIDPWQSS
ncbi:MAG TPA: type II toxin-antitoxin system VapC family toxin [Candidatus Obscuribacterales bacterium]